MRKSNYPYLVSKIVERGIRRTTMAARLNINVKTFYNKLFGDSEFTWDEARILHRDFFPDVEYDQLMS